MNLEKGKCYCDGKMWVKVLRASNSTIKLTRVTEDSIETDILAGKWGKMWDEFKEITKGEYIKKFDEVAKRIFNL